MPVALALFLNTSRITVYRNLILVVSLTYYTRFLLSLTGFCLFQEFILVERQAAMF